MTLNPKSFGLSAGIIGGVMLFLITLISLGTGYATNFLNVIASIYPGYSITLIGSLIGLVYGFVDFYIGCYIFVWLYNKFEK